MFILYTTKEGIPGKQKTTYTIGRPVTGSIAPMSLNSYTKYYANGAYIDNGTYSLATVEKLTAGTLIAYKDKKLQVIGFIEGRYRNHVHLQVMSNV